MTDTTEKADASMEASQWLFSFGASDVETQSNRKGHMKFILNDDDSSLVTAFAGPDRLTNRLSMKKFVKSFGEVFGNDKPNASATYWDNDGDFINHVCEISGIRRKGKKYIIKTNLLHEVYIDTVLSGNHDDSLNISGIPNPYSIAEANFFIDSEPRLLPFI